MLKAEALKKAYRGSDVLAGLDVEVPPGTITAVVGPSGGGKSTLLRAMALLEFPDSGVVEIDGERHEFPGPAPRRAAGPWPRLGLVFQQLFLWPHLTLEENILLPARLQGTEGAHEEAGRLLDLFDLEAAARRYPNETSVGQRQRAALIRALVLRPRYLLLDEITSALDVEHVVRVHRELLRLRENGVGLLAVTHLIGFARNAADRILFMESGRIVESGDASILSEPKTKRFRDFLSLVEAGG